MRLKIYKVLPKAYEQVMALETLLDNSKLDKKHKELIKIRASQINKCGYCLDMHVKSALEAGEDNMRIHMLALWQKVPQYYTPEERIILRMTEEITLIHGGLSDVTYSEAIHIFDEEYVALIIMAVVTINSWNRIGVATDMEEFCHLQ